MTAGPRKKRRALRGLLWVIAAAIIALILLPVWFPWLAAPVARHFGLGFGSYERIGWSRFALNGVHGEWAGTELQLQRVEGALPATWLWRHFQSGPNKSPLFSLSNGNLVVAGGESQGSTAKLLSETSRAGRLMEHWLPSAELTNCTVQSGSARIVIESGEWQSGRLRAAVQISPAHGKIKFSCSVGANSRLNVSADWPDHAASLEGIFSRTNAGWQWQGELGWFTNRAPVAATFATNDWWPAQARMSCEGWRVPASVLPLDGYDDLVANVTASLASDQFELQATGFALPFTNTMPGKLSAARFALGVNGDSERVNFNHLQVQSPWLNAELTNRIGITRAGQLRAEPAELHVVGNFEYWPRTALAGKAEGELKITSQGTNPPTARFQFKADQFRAGTFAAQFINFRGAYTAPVFELSEFRAELAGGSALVADGAFDFRDRRISNGHWKLSGPLLHELVPGINYSNWNASGQVDGPLTNLTQRGEITFTNLQVARLRPLAVRANWSGEGLRLTNAEVRLTVGESELVIGGNANFSPTQNQVAATLNQLTLLRTSEERYSLRAPCGINVGLGPTRTPNIHWTLAVNALDWKNATNSIAARADIAWPVRGTVRLTLTNVASADFSDFFGTNTPHIRIGGMAAMAQWSNGPVRAALAGASWMTNHSGQAINLTADLQANEALQINLAALAAGHQPILTVTGAVPVKFVAGTDAAKWVWDKSRAIALAADWQDTQSNGVTLRLGAAGRLETSQPELHLRISGTPATPAAELTARAAKLDWRLSPNHPPPPRLENVQLDLAMRPDGIQLKQLVATLDGEPVQARADWPVSSEAWREWWAGGKLPDWDQASGQLKLKSAKMAAFAAYLPELLAPEGSLTANLELKPGKQLTGVLALTNAATRPLGPVTPLRDIATLVRLDGQRAELRNFRAQIGGLPVRADGFATLPEKEGSALEYFVNLSGTNVPLARSAEFLLRGNFAVSLRCASNRPPVLSGAITLRNGLYVQHASSMVWSTPVRPEWRPPYFSVTNEPFADWKLDLAVRGNRFLRARTPVFSSVLSVDLQLRGSLRSPVLTGDARVNSGRVIFPFGALDVDQGLASFSGNDPNGPHLQINASGRNYRYDLRLEVNGPADGASVIFSSTPPLTSEQILLMVTAGEIPQSDYSFSSSARAGRLATFLGKDLFSQITGSDPTEERLIIRTGESISDTGRLTYSVEYRLTDRWSIRGEYDEFNAFNADLKWRIFTR